MNESNTSKKLTQHKQRTTTLTIPFPTFQIQLVELIYQSIDDALDYHGNIWPSALYLALFFCKQTVWVVNKTILELGAGLCLPSITALKLGGKHCIVSDQSLQHLPFSLNKILSINNLPINTTNITPFVLTWGQRFDALNLLNQLQQPLDLIIGADILFHPKVYNAVFATYYFIAKAHQTNPSVTKIPPLLIAYEQRSSSHSLVPCLDYWKLELIQCIPATSLKPPLSCSSSSSSFIENSKENAIDDLIHNAWALDSHWNTNGIENIYILHIEMKR